ncbi:cycloisomerase [Ancylobacter sp. Lp-2]|uniref:cycloisomerase n=1 Tax=Ancylobacter sp. Lp-2 TaxID=2881339 RepID=UPI001E5D7F95|nr:cycloisomerase [Ancylobacter sp. Lp-2]MCB4768372.1 cycloisomerase [Ancylobacter sp. Lp-2]
MSAFSSRRRPFLAAAAGAVLALALAAPAALAQEQRPAAETIKRFQVPEARQAVAVTERSFYAIDNRTIAKFDKETGKQVAKWEGPKGGPILHLDSGVVRDGKLYTAHSNYPDWPMVSSVEVWDAETLKHLESHSFGIDRGSFTWLDRDPQGRWWGAFANYNRVFDKSPLAYGNKFNTQIVRFNPDWSVAEAFVYPDALVARFQDMSNSGGAFGPDGRLYITGHDNAELYVIAAPEMGSVMQWLETIPLEIGGQGFAFDPAERGVVWGLIRNKAGGPNDVTVSRLPPRP